MYSVGGEGVCCDFRWDEKDCRGIWTFGAGHRNLLGRQKNVHVYYTYDFLILVLLYYLMICLVRKL